MIQGFAVFVHLQTIKTLVVSLSFLSLLLFRVHLLLARFLYSVLEFVYGLYFASEIRVLLLICSVLFYLFPSVRENEILDNFEQ